MKVLVIGGTGLISSSIVPLLLDEGHRVDVFSRGQSPRDLPTGARHLPGDRSVGDLEPIAANSAYDCVIDMICFRPDQAEETVRLFAGHVAQYIFTSTVDVYRKPAGRYPYREDEPIEGIGPYATGKAACERVFAHAAEDGFPVTVIRPAATYGEGHLPVHSLGRSTTYVDRLLRHKPIVVHGDGSSFWVSCHARDVARAYAGALSNPDSIGRAYHATGEEWLTWDQHHAAVAEAIGAPPPKLVHISTDALVSLAGGRADLVRDNLQFNNIFDNTAAHNDLGFEYRTDVGAGFREWFGSLISSGVVQDSDSDPFDDQLIGRWRNALPAGEVEARET